jgi:hypothetical protein
MVSTVAAVCAAVASLQAQQAISRTPDGHPDLQGLWVNNTATPLERPRDHGDRTSFTEAEAKAYIDRYQLDRTVAISRDKDFELEAAGDLDTYEPGDLLPGRRNSLITDPPNGLLPPLTAAGQKALSERNAHLNAHYAENPEDLTLAERCLIVGSASVPPLQPAFYNNTLQIVQTADHVVIVSEMIHDARIIPITRTTHLPGSLRRWTGDSIGHWEGDTLVVETTNFTAKTTFRGTTPDLRLIERFAMKSPGVLAYSFTVNDPAFTRPWTADTEMTATEGPMYEYACHEGNYSLGYILSGRRYSEKK